MTHVSALQEEAEMGAGAPGLWSSTSHSGLPQPYMLQANPSQDNMASDGIQVRADHRQAGQDR